jgi:ATP-dependent DNA ligase
VRQLRERTPAHYIAFDLLALGSADLRGRRFDERRPRLAEVLGDAAPPLHISPSTSDAAVARAWLERPAGGGIDGVVVKAADLVYEPGVRAMVKVKHERTVDCVVGGFRLRADKPGVGSLLLGLYDDKDELRHVGVASSFSDRRRRELFDELRGRAAPLDGHPWEQGYLLGGGAAGRLPGAAGRWSAAEMELDWVPLSPQPVCEVAYDHVDVDRFRHPARFRRWRPDRDPGSCRLSQLEGPHLDPFEVLGMT